MPYGTGLALSTLRTLARRQGVPQADPDSEEQPGKILHEVRNTTLELGGMSLPPVYYGTVDATPLFVCTLADAWRWGADRDEVAALLPAARRCLEWVLAPVARSPAGCATSTCPGAGWPTRAGRTASTRCSSPTAGSPTRRSRCARSRATPTRRRCAGPRCSRRSARSRSTASPRGPPTSRSGSARDFWVDTPEGGHVAIALDGEGRPVDSVTSNMGHLLGTGLLDEAQTARVVEVLTAPDLASGFGLRTLTTASPRFSRLSYHGGSVWPHDTAIAVRGLALEGRTEEAAQLASGLVAAAEGVAYRLPELYGGDAASDVPFPADYPASCRPQAWAAAAPLACLVAVTGLDVDAPAGTLTHPVAVSTRLGAFTLHGVRAGDEALTVSVDGAGRSRWTRPRT